MSTLNDVVINKLSGGLGRRNPDQDMVSGLLFDGEATTKGFEKDKVYRLASLEDAEALGITAAYDVDGQSAYYQIEQFFRMNPSGDLFIMATTGTSYGEVVGKAMEMQEKTDGKIRQMAVIYADLDAAFAQTTTAVATAQTQANLAYAAYMPFEVILEGKKFDVDTAPNLAALNATNVSVVIAMDAEKANEEKLFLKGATEAADTLYTLAPKEVLVVAQPATVNTPAVYNIEVDGEIKEANGAALQFVFKKIYKNSAAVGMALGTISKAKVSENIAWIEKFNLAGEGFAKAGFVGGKEIKTQGTLSTLNDNRYIFAKTHTGLAGLYFNDSHTCTEGTSDFAYVENNRTINKATRLLRTALLPKLASPVLVDISGKLPQSVSKDFEGLCRAALEGMVANQEVSAFDVYVNPSQNILATSELRVKAEIIPIGTARKITVDLGFKNPFGIDKA